jgi:ADP-ribosyltransferase exoenzyme
VTFLRRVLPKSWFTDVDYDRREDIDWRDVWDPSVHPRLPGGTEHGGEFTSGGGGAGGGLGISSGLPSGGFSTASHTNVPTPKAAVVQKHGGAKKLASLVAKHLQTGEDPHLTAQAIKAYGNAYVNAGYASYANSLLSHVEQAHGMAAGTLGKAKAAAPMGKGGPAPQGAPSEAEMAAMHAAAEADEPAPDEDEWDKPSPTEQQVALGNTAAGTDPKKLQAIAGDPAALNELSDSAHKLGITVMGHVTKEAKAAKSEVGTWTDPSGYKMIQNHLNGVQTSPHAAEVADKLQKAILSTELLSPVNTYRGVHGPQLDMISAMQPGDVWTQKGFAGSTLDPKRATHYAKGGQGGDMIHMVLPKGSKALYVSNPALNSWEAEREMLLPAGSTFKYIGKTTINLPQYDYSGKKVGEGGPVTLHQVEVMQPGSPEFEAAHPRGEGGKFVAKPGAEAEADAKAAAATPPSPAVPMTLQPDPYSAAQKEIHQIATSAEGTATGWSNEEKIEALKDGLDDNTYSIPEDVEFAKAWITHLGGQPVEIGKYAGTVPASAVENIAQSTATNHNQKLQILNELKAKAVELNHDPTQIDLGISMLQQKQKDFEQSLPMPDGTAVQQEMWEVAANPGFKHETKIAQVQSDIDSMNEGPGKEYNKQLLAHLKGETYTPSAPAPKGPDPYPGSKGQQAIYEYATHPDPGVTVAEKISGIKSVLAHPNAGPQTQAFGEQWIAALDPSQAATPAAAPTPAPAPAPTPTPAAKPWASLETINNVHGRAAKPPKNVIRGNKKLARIQNAYDWEAKAAQPPSTSTPEAQKIAPSIKKAFWNKVDGGVKQSISLYGGSDYYDINGSLRGDPNYPMTPKVQGWINDMDQLFYDDAAATTEHMIVRRGEDTPKADIDRWKIELAKGDKACLNTRSGYTSASVADQSAFSSKPVQWHFVVPKGTRILGIAGTVGHHENEILFPHGQQTEIYEMWEADGQQHIKAILR